MAPASRAPGSMRSKRGLCARAVAAGDHEIESRWRRVCSPMMASTAPAAVQPRGEVADGEAIKHLEHLGRPP